MPRTANQNSRMENLEAQLKETRNRLKLMQQEAKTAEAQYKRKCQDALAQGVEMGIGIMEKWIIHRDRALEAVDRQMHKQIKAEAKKNKERAAKEPKKSAASQRNPAKKVAPRTAPTSAKRNHRPAKQERPVRQESLISEMEEPLDIHSENIE